VSIIPVLPAPTQATSSSLMHSPDHKLREAAIKLEATFLSEMLKSAGFGAMEGSFGGGIGEEQFVSMLRDAQAENMVNAGGIGLAEALFEAMKTRMQ